MKRFPQCERITKAPIIPLEEKQSKIIFENPTQLEVCILTVDHKDKGKGAIQDGLRCDYALTTEEIDVELYVELKGRDIKHAFKQLEATIQRISEDPRRQSKYCFVIASRCTLEGSDIRIMKAQMKKKYSAELVIKNRQHTHILEN
jgi:exopolysaccharide biosynthesis predicted pyruvyltransferase EpsI